MNLLKTRNILIFFFLSFFIFSALIFIGDYRKIEEYLSYIKINVLLLLLVFSFGNYIIRFVKWQFFLRIIKINVNLMDSFLIFLSGFSMTFTPMKIGETIKSYFLHKMYKINIRTSLPVIFGERLTDLFGLVILSLIGISSFFINLKFLIGILILLIVSIFSLRNEKIFYLFIKLLSKIKIIEKYLGDMSLFHKNLKEILSPRSITISIILSVASWGLEAFALYFLITNLGFNVPLLSILFIYAFSSIIGALAFVPGGLGITEGSMLSLLMVIGLPISIASLSTIVIRVTTLWFGIVVGIISFFTVSKKTS